MHHIHRTKALVLSSFPFGEAGKVLSLLTEDFGVIRVNAQGTRKIQSKLRQSIQDFSLSRVAMVYGKKGWILTNASIIQNYYHDFTKEQIEMISRVFSLVERMIPDEAEQQTVFNMVLEMLDFVKEKHDNLENVEIMTVLKIMNELGYIGDEGQIQKQIQASSDVENENRHEDFLKYVTAHSRKIVDIINNAIKESHL